MTGLHHLALIWTGVLVAVVVARLTRLTPVLWFLFVGFLLVNIGWLPVETGPFIRTFAEVGIIVIMFALGFEENVGNFISSAKKSWGIAFFGVLVPFLTAYLIALNFWQDINIALMCRLTMTATAVSLTMMSLRSEGLHTSNVDGLLAQSGSAGDHSSLEALLRALRLTDIGRSR